MRRLVIALVVIGAVGAGGWLGWTWLAGAGGAGPAVPTQVDAPSRTHSPPSLTHLSCQSVITAAPCPKSDLPHVGTATARASQGSLKGNGV